jgi:hypothetical protein
MKLAKWIYQTYFKIRRQIMLFVALLKPKGGTLEGRIAHRAGWRYPEGVEVVAEYWLQAADVNVVSVFEADSIAPIMAITTEWGDEFDITVVPAITGQEGLKLVQQMR